MPLYEYECNECGLRAEQRRSVEGRDRPYWCNGKTGCQEGQWVRVFTPTANIVIGEHFRHLQSDFLPAPGDTEAWEARGNASQAHTAKKDDGREFEEFVRRDMARQGVSL
jgi:putative FmdB family regulatory protein